MKTKSKILSLIAVITFAITLNGQNFCCDKNKSNKQCFKKEYKVGKFSNIEAEGVFKIIITQGREEKCIVETDKNEQFNRIIIDNKNNKLTIKQKDIKKNKNEKNKNCYTTIYLTINSIDNLSVSGVLDISTATRLYLPNLNIEFSGVGNLDIDVACKKIFLISSSVGNIKIKGYAVDAIFENSGVGIFNTYFLLAQNLKISNEGVGTSKVYASNSIDIESSGVGCVYYKGSPRYKKINSSGVGKIIKEN